MSEHAFHGWKIKSADRQIHRIHPQLKFNMWYIGTCQFQYCVDILYNTETDMIFIPLQKL